MSFQIKLVLDKIRH